MTISSQIHRKFIWSGVILLVILVIGTLGYWLIGGREYSFMDTLYMTVITISTIGFREVVDISSNPAGRIFTIFIAISGIGVLLYIVTNLTALVVEGELTESFRRRKMEKIANNSKEHYIVCGVGSVGSHIISELYSIKRPHVIVDVNKNNIEKALELVQNGVFIEGDAIDDTTLLKAGIEKAKGLFAVTGDDSQNLIISLTAKQLNPNLRVVARCNEIKNSEKIKKAGADAIVSPTSIGGLRMASEMIRPTVVSFLDIMLRDREKNLRVEEISVPHSFVGENLANLNLKRFTHTLLLAIKVKQDWVYNPPDNHVLTPENTLVFITTPEERNELERYLHADK
ncbi:potassium channel family protein [Chloroflexota bacterium]